MTAKIKLILIALGVVQIFLAMNFSGLAQEKSVNPGINDSFKDPKVQEYIEKFEIESREVFQRRDAILAACAVKPGATVADVGAGTGLFTRLFSKSVGDQGRVIAVDISRNFLEHIAKTNREQDLRNIDTLLCTAESTELQAETIDFAFICDTYHHFEYPTKTMASLHKALRPGGRLVVIDFKRVEGQSTPWVMSHVRAGQEVFEKEILECGFFKLEQKEDLLKENYFLVFQKPR
jgi:ubiquinone/menaquinone biosynthesis C-methylase UbiE